MLTDGYSEALTLRGTLRRIKITVPTLENDDQEDGEEIETTRLARRATYGSNGLTIVYDDGVIQRFPSSDCSRYMVATFFHAVGLDPDGMANAAMRSGATTLMRARTDSRVTIVATIPAQ